MEILLIGALVFGAVIGSFLGAATYRIPKGINIAKGRSKCPKCGHQINWFDNIPILSFLILGGKCRYCHKKISLRYPLIEIITAISFAALVVLLPKVINNLPWLADIPSIWSFVLLLIFLTILIAIFVIDLEYQIIPDELVFIGLIFLLGIFTLTDYQKFFTNLMVGLSSALFLLGIHLITRGRGMGLGDVKFALFAGTFLGFPAAVTWFFASFILGGIVGLLLIVTGRAKMSQRVAFGPFLVSGFIVTLLWGSSIGGTIFPYGFGIF